MVYCESKAAIINYGDKGDGANCWEDGGGRGGGDEGYKKFRLPFGILGESAHDASPPSR